MAAHAVTTPARVFHPDAIARFEAALADLALGARQQLELIVEAGISALDQLDGDCDLEIECEDEGAQCEDEGVSGYEDPDREPSLASLSVLDQRQWSDHQDLARCHFVDGELDADDEEDHRSREDIVAAQRRAFPHWQNVGEFIPVRAL